MVVRGFEHYDASVYDVLPLPPIDVRDKLPVVVPIHRPKMAWLCQLLLSAVNTSVAVFPVFSTQADVTFYAANFALPTTDVYPLVAAPDHRNPVTTKKMRGVHEVFNRTTAAHCLCLDAESKVQSGAADWRPYLDAYAAAQTVLVAKVEDHRHNKTAAEGHHLIGEAVERAGCRIAGLAPLKGYTWFQDAPVFDRCVRTTTLGVLAHSKATSRANSNTRRFDAALRITRRYDFFDFEQRVLDNVNRGKFGFNAFEHVAYQVSYHTHLLAFVCAHHAHRPSPITTTIIANHHHHHRQSSPPPPSPSPSPSPMA